MGNPLHAEGWLNLAEIEIGVVPGAAYSRERLCRETGASEAQRVSTGGSRQTMLASSKSVPGPEALLQKLLEIGISVRTIVCCYSVGRCGLPGIRDPVTCLSGFAAANLLSG